MASIELTGINKSFGSTNVLRNIDLNVRDGEFLTLVGPSGCGKSTLLRILAGLEEPDAGDISINGTSVRHTRAAQRNLAMVFQSYALYPHLTVSENMMTPLKLRDLSFKQRLPIIGPLIARKKHLELLKQVEDTANALKITDLLKRKPGQLSGGQRQRVALGRAMVRKPVAFLMDEPLSNLDAALRVHMRSELVELHRQLETTFVYVTHDQVEALTMSNRMAVMHGGNIMQLASPAEIYARPANLTVARFIGSPHMNILSGDIKDGEAILYGKNLAIELNSYGPSKIWIGFRPEHIILRSATDNKALLGQIKTKENLGSDYYFYIILDDSSEKIIARVSPEQAANYSVGQKLGVDFASQHLHLFGSNEKRLEVKTSIQTPPSIQAPSLTSKEPREEVVA